ncbi:hypothetical protein [Flavobacterium sp.]|uniref:hypothetical protein n=1 Tax=Flavobacterium sp. TaxID=239 RepID=UPI0039E68CC2
MDTSVTLIGLAITVLIAIPLYKVFRSNSLNKKKINELLAQHPQFHFGQTETLNKKFYALDQKNKGFFFIDFNFKPEHTAFVDLNTVSSCRLVPTTENFSGDTLKLELEFLHKNSDKDFVAVYNIEHDQITQVCLHEDQEMAKKWQKNIILTLAT